MSDARLSPQGLRVTVADVDDSGPQQFVHGTGLSGQDIGRMVRVQHFGLSSTPPAGSEGHGLALGGGADRLFALGMEHPGLRPRGLPGGATALYDAAGNIIKLVGTEVDMSFSVPWKVTARGVTITSDGQNITIQAPGAKILLGTGPYFPVQTTGGPSSQVMAGM